MTLVVDRDQLTTFDAVFDRVFGGLADLDGVVRNADVPPGVARRARPAVRRPAGRRSGGGGGDQRATSPDAGGDAAERPAWVMAASSEERLAAKPFGECTPGELDRLRALIADLLVDPPSSAFAAVPGWRGADGTSTAAPRCAWHGGPVATRCTSSAADRAGGCAASCCSPTCPDRWSPTVAPTCTSSTAQCGRCTPRPSSSPPGSTG